MSTPPSLRQQASAYAAVVRGVDPVPKRFVLFAQGRSGSTLLSELIGSHTDVAVADEILYHRVLLPRLWVEGRSRKQRAKPTFGFHVKLYQLIDTQHVRDPAAWLRRLSSDGWLVLHNWRRNVVRQVLSNATRDARGAAHDRGDRVDQDLRLRVDTAELLHYARLRTKYLEDERRILEGIDHVTFSYEDDLLISDKWQATADRAFAFLGVESQPVTTSLRRINAAPLPELIENYTDVERALAGTPFASMLHD